MERLDESVKEDADGVHNTLGNYEDKLTKFAKILWTLYTLM